MALYTDPHLIVDTDLIAACVPFDGTGDADGLYGLSLVLVVSDTRRSLEAIYVEAHARDAAMAQLVALIRADEAEYRLFEKED